LMSLLIRALIDSGGFEGKINNLAVVKNETGYIGCSVRFRQPGYDTVSEMSLSQRPVEAPLKSQKWTPLFGPRNAEIKLGLRVCWN
jgi:hypothetical protein